MQPVDYISQLGDPLEDFASGYQVSRGIQQAQRQDMLQAEEDRMRPILQEQAMARQNAIMGVAANPQSTLKDWQAIMPLMEQKQLEAWSKIYAQKGDEANRDNLSFGLQVSAAYDNGDIGLANEKIKERITMLQNGKGDPREISTLQIALADPKRGAFIIKSGTAGLQHYQSAMQGLQTGQLMEESQLKLPGELAKQQADVADKYSQISDRSADNARQDADLQLRREKQNQEMRDAPIKLTASQSAYVLKKGNDAQEKYAVAADAQNIAEKFKNLNARGGIVGKGMGALRQVVGEENKLDLLRKQAEALRTDALLVGLQKMGGSDSNSDRIFMEKPLAEVTANPKFLAEWLDGYARAQTRKAALDDSMGAWVEHNRALARPAMQDMEIYGIAVPKGTAYEGFRNAFVNREIKKYGTTGTDRNTGSVSPAPKGASNDWRDFGK